MSCFILILVGETTIDVTETTIDRYFIKKKIKKILQYSLLTVCNRKVKPFK